MNQMLYSWLSLYGPSLVGLLTPAVIALALWVWTLQRRLKGLEARYRRLTQGVEVSNLEALLLAHVDRVQAAVERTRVLDDRVTALEQAAQGHVQHVSVVRFNPFTHTGGDQSFVLVLANGQGDGAVITSLHAREGTRIYAKPLQAWTSTYALMDEEQAAIARARGSEH